MKHLFFALAALTLSLSLYSQNRPRKEFSPEEVATKQAMELREKIENITDQQYEQIYAIYLWRAQESKAERDSVMATAKEGERPRMNREKMMQRENVVTDALKLILDEKQYAAYEKMQQERRQRARRPRIPRIQESPQGGFVE